MTIISWLLKRLANIRGNNDEDPTDRMPSDIPSGVDSEIWLEPIPFVNGVPMDKMFRYTLRLQGITSDQCSELFNQSVATIDDLLLLTESELEDLMGTIEPMIPLITQARVKCLRAWGAEVRSIKGDDAELELLSFTVPAMRA